MKAASKTPLEAAFPLFKDIMDPLALQQKLSPLFKPFSGIYGTVMRVRRTLRERSPSRYVCPSPCVSIGNIAWGGTGKTPLVEWLMHWATAEKLRAVVLSRGYRAKLRKPPVHILPEHRPEDVGDEPLMLAHSCPHVPVIVDPVRRRSAAYAAQTFAPQLIFLDDGFQHVALARDVDLVLLRPEDLHDQWNKVIPAGSWRESASALERAGAFLIKCRPELFASLHQPIRQRLEQYKKPVFNFFLEPQALRPVNGYGTDLPLFPAQPPYTLLTGVAQPEQVRQTVTTFLGYAPETCLFRPDHHAYSADEVRSLTENGKRIICTAKDAVKLRQYSVPNFWYLHTSVAFGHGMWTDQTFPEWWNAWWQQTAQHPTQQDVPS